MNITHAQPRRNNRPSLASNINEIVVTIWLGASFYIMYATGGKNEFYLFLPLVLGAVAFVAMTLKKPVIARVDPLLSFGVFLLISSILASYLFNSQWYDPIFIAGNLISTALLFISLYTITTKIDLDFRKTLVFQCIFATLLLPVVLATSKFVWGRLEPAELHPNYVSMMAMLCVIGACSVRSLWMALALSALPVYTIVAMESRDSMVAAGIGVIIIVGYHLWRLGFKKLRPYLAVVFLGGPIVCMALFFAGIDVFGHAYDVVNGLFLLDDEHRGLSSGGSGRTDLWDAAINLWLTHPVFGVGFKGTTQMMPDQMPAHSAYLGMLTDTGTVGFISYLLIVGVALYRILNRGDRGLSEYPQRLAIVVSYLVYGMVESRAFSFGNSYSVLFLLVAFDSAKFRLPSRPALKLPGAKPSAAPREPVSAPAIKAISRTHF